MIQGKDNLTVAQTPGKAKITDNSPDTIERTGKLGQKDKIQIPSFLDGFSHLTEDDMAILAEYEEEQQRKGHFETLFPTRETIETLGPYFDC